MHIIQPNKFEELIQWLGNSNAIHVFDGTLGTANRKIDLTKLLCNNSL